MLSEAGGVRSYFGLSYRHTEFPNAGGVRSHLTGEAVRKQLQTLRYPVEGSLGGGVTVAIPDFLSTLIDAVDLSHTLVFFKRWEGTWYSPVDTTDSLTYDDRALQTTLIESQLPPDTLHLLIPLIDHQRGSNTGQIIHRATLRRLLTGDCLVRR